MNPIKEYCYIRISDLNEDDVVARSSDSALSFYYSVVEEVPACVIRKECYQKYKDISIHENEIEEFNGLISIENYYYLPEYSKNQFINILDIISIYKDSYDNRIQIEIEELEDKLNDEMFR